MSHLASLSGTLAVVRFLSPLYFAITEIGKDGL